MYFLAYLLQEHMSTCSRMHDKIKEHNKHIVIYRRKLI